MLKTFLLLASFGLTVLAADNYFKVLIREIDNPAGTLNDGKGTKCSTEFGFLGIGCNTYLRAAVTASGQDVGTITETGSQINSHMETKISDINVVVSDENAVSASSFSGFDIHIQLSTDPGFSSLIADSTVHVDSTDSQGVSTLTISRPGTLAVTVSLAWSTNIAPPSTTSTPEPTTTGVPFTGSTLPPTTTPKPPVDCSEISNTTSGVYSIYPDGTTAISVYCDKTSYGDYTVIQSRGSLGNISFDVPYANYTEILGTPGKGYNYWFGLDNMNTLTTNGKNYKMQIDLCCGTALVKKYIYHSFSVESAISNYTLKATADIPGVGLAFSSQVTDIGAQFSTYARYNRPIDECDQFDYIDDNNKQSVPYGGWWFGSCGNNLNGFMYASNNGNCNVTAEFTNSGLLGVNMRTTTGQGAGGYNVDMISYDRVRMALFTFDSATVDIKDDSFCQ